MKRVFLISILGLSLAACSQSDEEKQAEFLASFGPACVTTATDAGTPQEIAENVCTCSGTKIIEEMGIPVNVPPPLANKVIDECIQELDLPVQG